MLFRGSSEVFLTDEKLTIRECPVVEQKKREVKQVISKSVMTYCYFKTLI